MKILTGIYLGTGSAMKLGLGFNPDKVIIRGAAGVTIFTWTKDQARVATAAGGVVIKNDAATQQVIKDFTAGIRAYAGGEVLAAADANILSHISLQDASSALAVNVDQKGSVSKFTMDTAAAGTGHFDALIAAAGAYAGVGSKVVLWVPEKRAEYTTYLRAQGTWTAANGVTLDPDAPATAEVRYIGPQYDFLAHPVGVGTPTQKGIVLLDTTYLADATVHTIEAYQF